MKGTKKLVNLYNINQKWSNIKNPKKVLKMTYLILKNNYKLLKNYFKWEIQISKIDRIACIKLLLLLKSSELIIKKCLKNMIIKRMDI